MGANKIVIYAGQRARDAEIAGKVHPDKVVFAAELGEHGEWEETFIISTLEAKHRLAAKAMRVVGTRRQSCDSDWVFETITLGTQTADGPHQLVQVSQDNCSSYGG